MRRPGRADVRAAVERAARDFEAAGAIVEPLAPFLTQDMLDGLDRFWRMRSLIDIKRACRRSERAKILPFIRAWAELAQGFSGEAVFHGFSRIPEMREAAVAATQPFDYVISPTAPITAFAAELASPSDDPLDPFPHIGFTVAYNMSDQPAASINCGFEPEGLPIGLQIVGRRFDDVGVISLAMAFEAMRAGEARPGPSRPRRTSGLRLASHRPGGVAMRAIGVLTLAVALIASLAPAWRFNPGRSSSCGTARRPTGQIVDVDGKNAPRL